MMQQSETIEAMNRANIGHIAKGRRASLGSSWHGTAFLIEALLLLALLTGCVAVFMQLFAQANAMGTESASLSGAVQIASNEAETFAADPHTWGVGETSEDVDGYTVTRTVEAQDASHGTLYVATILVEAANDSSSEDAVTYTLSTSRYVSEVNEVDGS